MAASMNQCIRVRRWFCAMALLPAMLFAGHGQAQESTGSASLELRLELQKTALVLGEPAYATIHIKNVGANPAEVNKILDPQTGAVHIELSSAGTPRLSFLPLFYADTVDPRMALEPGEEVAAAFPIFYGALGWSLTRPDTYHVSAWYGGSRKSSNQILRSNMVAVTVSEEGGIGASLMDDGQSSQEAGKFLLWQRGDHLQAGQRLLTDLIAKHPDSPVSDYALLAFGRNLSRDFRNYAAGQVRQADCRSALEYFHRVKADRLPVFLQIQLQLDEARCRIKMDEPSEAGKAFEQAERLSGNRREYSLLFDQAVRLEPGLKQFSTAYP
ncbi:hypothetical protein W02_35980 [Nitrospira sp. KM1]|uniref:hypothetical protein n=1 Tax=Nitrospira sp. KM1 TaxID=1936990 RepID=UPI0013A7A283|nr:hypothetical protein [Nitrospira sp. KM1]BCA56458.1 hypothetical protein W02_35980 [Nitrospira sp. KM1]